MADGSDQTQPTREDWIKAGKISGEVLAYGKSLMKKGIALKEVCDKCDEKIISLGAIPAFPAQISCNNIAAHYCPDENDNTLFEDQVASLDLGACVNGAIGDNAVTVDLSEKYSDLVKASRDALNSALKIIAPGTSLGDIGKEIQDTIQSYGYSPVRNLSGHGLDTYNIHTKPSIPNVDTRDKTELQEGMHIAIEPFASDGKGMIYESANPTIFSFIQKRPVRSPYARDVLKLIQKYKGLPFAKRWISREIGNAKANLGLKLLEKEGIIKGYAPLPDEAGGIVSQAEHSVLVEEKPVITTKINE